MLFNEAKTEEVAHPGEYLARIVIVDAGERIRECLPLKELRVRNRRIDDGALARSRRLDECARLLRVTKLFREVRNHGLHSVGEQIALCVLVTQLAHGARR